LVLQIGATLIFAKIATLHPEEIHPSITI